MEINFNSEDEPPIIFALDAQSSGNQNIYTKIFRITSPCVDIKLVFEPATDKNEILSFEIKRMGSLAYLYIGLRKFISNIRSPIQFIRKLRQFFSGAANLSLTPINGQQTPDHIAYTKWRNIFEGPLEKTRLQAAYNSLSEPKLKKVLAVYLSACDNPRALNDFLANFKNTEIPCAVYILVIEQVGHELPSDLRELASSRGSDFVSMKSKSVPVDLLLDKAQTVDAGSFLFIEQRGHYHALALPSFMLQFSENPECQVIYGDDDEFAGDGQRAHPRFKPEWSREYALSNNYVGPAIAFRAAAQLYKPGLEISVPQAASYEVLLQVDDQDEKAKIKRIPRILFHRSQVELTESQLSRRQGAEETVVRNHIKQRYEGASLETFKAADGNTIRRIRDPLPATAPLVSVLIPSKDNPQLLYDAVNSVSRSDYPNAEIIIIDNGSQSTGQLELLARYSHEANIKVFTDPSPFNFSRLINKGRREAHGDVLVLLNDDVKAINTDWLDEMVSLAIRPDVGCVGALLLYGNGTIQHAGVLMGINGGAAHAFRQMPEEYDEPGYRLKIRHEVSAVTAACLAVKSEVFDSVGGFDEELPVTLNDIDFCLKVKEFGYKNIMTPFARLYHYESVTRGLDETPERLQRLSRETSKFNRKWGAMRLQDPYYSPHLTRSHSDYRMRIKG